MIIRKDSKRQRIFLWNKVQTKEEIPLEYFDASVTTNRIILQWKELGNKN
jgi:hypothetical protein